MADNDTTGDGKPVATDKVTHSGDADQNVQLVRPVQTTGSEGSKTVVDWIGEVQASPTSNTLLARLKDLLTGIVLAAGTNAIGKLSANSGVNIGDVRRTDGTNVAPSMDVAARAGYQIVTNGTLSVGVVDETGTSAVDAHAVGGGTPHDSVNSGNPLLGGAEAIAHGANPTAVAAADRTKLYANRAGIPFVIGGHPNVIPSSARITGSNTDTALAPTTVNSGTKVVITRLTVTISNATTVNVGVKIGFGASTIPADSSTGAAGVIVDNDGFPPGGGVNIGDGSGIVAVGGDGEELRITNDAPTSGAIHVSYSYYTIES